MFPKLDYEYVSYDELYDAYSDCRKHKWKTPNAANFQMDLSKNLYKLWFELNKGTYKIGKSITFIVDKPVKREVFAADFRDRIVHHLLINRIMDAFEEEMIDNSFSCRKSKGTLCGIKTLEQEIKLITENYSKNAYVLKCDLKSFFMTINKEILYSKIDSLIKNKVYPNNELQYKFTTNLAKLIIYNCPQDGCKLKQSVKKWHNLPKEKSLFNTPRSHGLPIGNLTSQIFANYFLQDFDKFIYNELGFSYYGRYVDDFYILSTDKLKLIKSLPLIKRKLSEVGIKLHPNKIYLQDIKKGVKFIGGIVKPYRTYIAKRTVGNLKSMLYNKNVEFENADEITVKMVNDLISSYNSYMGFLKHHSTFNIRKKLLKNILMNKFLDKCYFNESLTKMIPFKNYSYYNKGINLNHLLKYPDRYFLNIKYLPAIVLTKK